MWAGSGPTLCWEESDSGKLFTNRTSLKRDKESRMSVNNNFLLKALFFIQFFVVSEDLESSMFFIFS